MDRGRRAQRPTGDDRQQAILATAEHLLQTRTLAEISIDDLARGAGISRPSFYFYFASKEAVLLTLLDRVVAEVAAALEPLVSSQPEDPRAAWQAAIEVFFDTFRAHRAVALAAAATRGATSEIGALWSSVMLGWVELTAGRIEEERARGAAPAGLDARELAVALNLMNERMLYATFAGEAPQVGEDRVVEVLVTLWLMAIYGS